MKKKIGLLVILLVVCLCAGAILASCAPKELKNSGYGASADGGDDAASLDNYIIEGTTITALSDIGVHKKELVVPNTITAIGPQAFSYYGYWGDSFSELEKVTIPNSVTEIGAGAFSGCHRLTSITLPFVGGSRTAQKSAMVFGYIFGTKNYTYSAAQTCHIAPADWDYGFTFYLPAVLRTVEITDAAIIPALAFYNCAAITSVTLPNGVTKIGANAFSRSGITSINLPNTLKEIGEEAFEHSGFGGDLIIPDSVTAIGYGAFYGCGNLTSVTIGKGITVIPDGMFVFCRNITSVTFVQPSSVERIGGQAFYECQFTGIALPSSLKSIGCQAFQDTALTSLTIPKSVTSIHRNNSAFGSIVAGCKDLVSLTVEAGNPRYKSDGNCIIETNWVADDGSSVSCEYFDDLEGQPVLLFGCATSVIPSYVTGIFTNAFVGVEGLTTVTIPDTVKIIGSGAFVNTGLTGDIFIPISVERIYSYYNYFGAFSNYATGSSLTIYVEATSRPNYWPAYWAVNWCGSGITVVWGAVWLPNQVSKNSRLKDLIITCNWRDEETGDEYSYNLWWTYNSFETMQTSYTANVGSPVTITSIVPLPKDENATFVIEGGDTLTVGSNIIRITVTAEDGVTKTVYSFDVILLEVEGPTVTTPPDSTEWHLANEALRHQIDLAIGLTEADYTEESWEEADLVNEVHEAEMVLYPIDWCPTIEELFAARTKLIAAVSKLELRDKGIPGGGDETTVPPGGSDPTGGKEKKTFKDLWWTIPAGVSVLGGGTAGGVVLKKRRKKQG